MKHYLRTWDDKLNTRIFFRCILIAVGQVIVLVNGGGDEVGDLVDLVKILPLGSFYAPLANPSRK